MKRVASPPGSKFKKIVLADKHLPMRLLNEKCGAIPNGDYALSLTSTSSAYKLKANYLSLPFTPGYMSIIFTANYSLKKTSSGWAGQIQTNLPSNPFFTPARLRPQVAAQSNHGGNDCDYHALAMTEKPLMAKPQWVTLTE